MAFCGSYGCAPGLWAAEVALGLSRKQEAEGGGAATWRGA